MQSMNIDDQNGKLIDKLKSFKNNYIIDINWYLPLDSYKSLSVCQLMTIDCYWLSLIFETLGTVPGCFESPDNFLVLRLFIDCNPHLIKGLYSFANTNRMNGYKSNMISLLIVIDNRYQLIRSHNCIDLYIPIFIDYQFHIKCIGRKLLNVKVLNWLSHIS